MQARVVVAFLLSVCLAARSVDAAAVAYTVTNDASVAYIFSGVTGNNPAITVATGDTVTWTINSGASHPFALKTAPTDAGTGGGRYTAGVTGNGATSGTVTWTVAADAPPVLYYACENHAAMVGTIYVTGITIAVTATGVAGFNFGYQISALNPGITLVAGKTYMFAINSGTSHPFAIHTSSQTTATSARYTTGITGTGGAPTDGNGATSGTLVFSPPPNAPATLYYQCEIHSAMSGTITITGRSGGSTLTPTVSVVVASIAFVLAALQLRSDT